jgi:Tfp pilus assembly protein PilX
MSTMKSAARLKAFAPRQRGAALFIALIMLAAMIMAAVALIRTVDTSMVIAGNLAFKQASTSSADIALSNASDWIATTATTDAAALEADSAGDGYYATSTGLNLTDDATWVADASKLASGSCCTDPTNPGTDSSGNQIRYVIQRMCKDTGAATSEKCLFGAATTSSSSQAVKDATEAGGIVTLSASPMYRVTVRVSGPRNTVSYVQGFLY